MPGWHTTIFPPYFVAGAIYAGFAMVMTLAIPLRKIYGLEDFITMKHLDNMAKIMLATGLIVGYGYIVEAFMAYYSGNAYERYMIWNRMTGPYRNMYWALIFCNILAPQALWFRQRPAQRPDALRHGHDRQRRHVARALRDHRRQPLTATSCRRPGACTTPTLFDWSTFIGTIGLFLALMFLFIRLLPMISIFEMRTILPEAKVEEQE